MAEINAYLRFNGNCREAMTFYKDCLGGELALQAVGDLPMAEQMPPESHQNIIHSSLKKDGLVLLGSDMVGPEGRVLGNAISLSLTCTSEEEINTFFSKLSSGGEATNPLKTEFWGGTFGTLVDKFGNEWLLNYDAKAGSE